MHSAVAHQESVNVGKQSSTSNNEEAWWEAFCSQHADGHTVKVADRAQVESESVMDPHVVGLREQVVVAQKGGGRGNAGRHLGIKNRNAASTGIEDGSLG